MTWSTEEEARVQAIETKLNELQTAVNNLATKQQMKSLLNIRQTEIVELQRQVDSLASQVAALLS